MEASGLTDADTMSKIFQALQRSGHMLPVIDRPLLEEDRQVPADRTEQSVRIKTPVPAEPAPKRPSVPAAAALAFESERGPRALPVRLAACDPLLPFDTRSQRSVEQYRLIHTKITHHPASPQVVAISSAEPGDGKTVTAINIAGAMSLKAGTRVLLIDGDLRRSSIARVLGLPSSPGLTDVISQACSLDEAVVRLEQFPNCFILPAGTPSQNPSEMLDSPNWHALCQSVRAQFQHVIVDTSPIAAVADYELIESITDGVVMVVRQDHTKRAAFKKALAAIPTAKMIGLVLNDVSDWFLWPVQGSSYACYEAPEISGDTKDQARKLRAFSR
jgi:capsular exopolysaccharide synthesis family protein